MRRRTLADDKLNWWLTEMTVYMQSLEQWFYCQGPKERLRQRPGSKHVALPEQHMRLAVTIKVS